MPDLIAPTPDDPATPAPPSPDVSSSDVPPPADWTPPPGWVPPAGWTPPPGWRAPRGRRRRSTKIAAALVALVVVIGGVTGGVVLVHHQHVTRAAHRAEARREAQAAAVAAAARKRAAAKAAQLAKERAVFRGCQHELMPLYNSLQGIDARLDVGLTQAELSSQVGDASVAYSHIRVHALGEGTCLSAGADLEAAFNAYSSTATRWNDCIVDFGCDVDSILPGMRRTWSSASRKLDQAKALVMRLDPDSPRFDPAPGDGEPA